MAIDATERAVIVEVLCSQALADNLGDVRDSEEKLWGLLGAERLPYDEMDSESAFTNTKLRLERAGLSLPEYLEGLTSGD